MLLPYWRKRMPCQNTTPNEDIISNFGATWTAICSKSMVLNSEFKNNEI
jgi:hypothetical protein